MSRRTLAAFCLILTGAIVFPTGNRSGSGSTRAAEEWVAEFVQPCVGPPVCLFRLEIVDPKEDIIISQAYAPKGGCGKHRVSIADLIPEMVQMATRPARLLIWSISCSGVRSLSYDWILVDLEPFCSGIALTSHDGDANADGQVDLSDAIYLTQYLFLGGPHACVNAADINNDATLDISDVIQILHRLFGI